VNPEPTQIREVAGLSEGSASQGQHLPERTEGWSAVFALTLCVSTLIASEFMPVSLLTPLARDLHLTEGAAGQAISVSGIFAVITSLFIATATKGLDRRKLLLGLTLLMIASGLVVTFAPSFLVLMIGRALLGIVIGGFWSMTTATVMRLVPPLEVARALALLNGGNALATTIAAPIGSYLGQYIGWRGAFFSVVPLGIITLVWQFASLPPMPSDRAAPASNVFKLFRRPHIPSGMVALTFLFAGQFCLFTYLRPFLETVTGLGVSKLSIVLLIIGGAGLVGTYAISHILARTVNGVLIGMPLAMAVIAVALVALGAHPVPTALLLGFWGLVGTAAPVGWWTWLSRVLPNEAEAGGGLMVAVIQMAITVGAAFGGLLYDGGGHVATFTASAILLTLSGIAAVLGTRASSRASQRLRRRATSRA
jgi:predicted MFS family arabinose efflux permease